jgi:hypothetical protein
MMAGAGTNLDIGALASQAVGGGVAGAIVAAVVGLIKNKMMAWWSNHLVAERWSRRSPSRRCHSESVILAVGCPAGHPMCCHHALLKPHRTPNRWGSFLFGSPPAFFANAPLLLGYCLFTPRDC